MELFSDKLDKTAIALARTLQTDQPSKDNEGGAKTQLEKRRMTVHNIASNLKETKGGQGATLDLEKSFRNRFKSLSKYLRNSWNIHKIYWIFSEPDTLEQSANPNLRRLSAHPKTFQALMHRQNSYFEGERRRSTIRRMSSQFSGKTNESFERDSVISETGQTLSCWIYFGNFLGQ